MNRDFYADLQREFMTRFTWKINLPLYHHLWSEGVRSIMGDDVVVLDSIRFNLLAGIFRDILGEDYEETWPGSGL